MQVRFRFGAVAIAVIAGAAMLGGLAQSAVAAWPERPIEMVCATSPSSGAAKWCRLFAEMLSKDFGQHVEVLFKGGGGGNTAAAYVAKKPADGYTWLQRNTSYAGYMNMPTFKPDPNDFEVVVEVEKFLYIMGVRSDSKYKTFEDVIADMKAHPGKISVAGNKPGSAHHRHLINLFNAFGVEWNYVPYKGSGKAMKDVLGGHVPIGIIPPGIWTPHVKAGKARSLLLLNEEHTDRIPLRIPKDLGKDYEFTHQVQGMFVLRGTPEDVKKRIALGFRHAVESDTYKEYVKKNVHVVPQFNDNGPEITKRFHQARKETGEFLRKAGLIN